MIELLDVCPYWHMPCRYRKGILCALRLFAEYYQKCLRCPYSKQIVAYPEKIKKIIKRNRRITEFILA